MYRDDHVLKKQLFQFLCLLPKHIWIVRNICFPLRAFLGVNVSRYSLMGKTSSTVAETESRGTNLADALLSGG